MSLRNQPYLPLYVQDFLTDEKLIECSAEATGIYIRLMCILHKSENYGKFLLKQKFKQTDKQVKNFALQFALHMPYDLLVIENGLNELLDNDVIQIDGDLLFQKRMVKDGEVSEKRAVSGSKGGKKTQTKNNNFASNFALAKIQANSEYENEYEYDIEYKNKSILDNIQKVSNSKKVNKQKYGEYKNVLLTDEEYKKLNDEFGNVDELIKFLDEYMGEKTYKSKSHYLSIRRWVVGAVNESKQKQGGIKIGEPKQNTNGQPENKQQYGCVI